MNQNRKVFISYAHDNLSQVKELAELLRAAGYDPWFDHRLLPGQDWKKELLEAITDADIFVYALTPESVASEWCQWEFAQAIRLGKPIIPVLLQPNTELPQILKEYQYADFTKERTELDIARFIGGLQQQNAQVTVAPDELSSLPINPKGRPAQVPQLLIKKRSIITGILLTITLCALVLRLLSFPMTGDFNIAVARFDEIGGDANFLIEPRVSLKIFNSVDAEYAGNRFGLDIQDRYYDSGVIRSYTDAENLAQLLNAQMVVYGTITHLGDQTYDIEPSFYIADSFAADVSEVAGSHRLGETISVVSEDQLGSVLNDILPTRIRILVEFSQSLAYIQADRLNLARGSIVNAIQIANTDEDFKNQEIFFLFASHIARLEGDFEQARTDIETALTINANYGRAYIGRGNINYDLGKQAFQNEDYVAAQGYLASAITDYERAKQLPDQPPEDIIVEKADTGVGQVYTIEFLISGRADYADKAISRFEAIIESYNRNPEPLMKGLMINALYWSGVIYHTQGNLTEAETAFRQVLDLDNNTDYTADIERRLADIEQQK